MRTAVIRVNLDPDGELGEDRLSRAVEALRTAGTEVLAPDFSRVPPHAREIELLVEGDDPVTLRSWAEARCAEALGAEVPGAPGPRAGAATFLSRGTDEDALGVVGAFGISAELDRFWDEDEEIAVFTITREAASHVAESRLHTALEAALNCEVRIIVAAPAQSGPPQSAPAQSAPAQSGPAHSERGQSEPARTAPAQDGRAPTGRAHTGPAQSGRAGTAPAPGAPA
jgi:hypothetical protein